MYSHSLIPCTCGCGRTAEFAVSLAMPGQILDLTRWEACCDSAAKYLVQGALEFDLQYDVKPIPVLASE